MTLSGSLITIGKTDRLTDLWKTSSETKAGKAGACFFQIKEKPLSSSELKYLLSLFLHSLTLDFHLFLMKLKFLPLL